MPPILTAGTSKRLSEFYHQLASMIAAGVSLPEALRLQIETPSARFIAKGLSRTQDYLEQGYHFAEALRESGDWLPPFDISLIDAAEKSGRLDSSFRLLSDYYQQRAELSGQVVSSLLYPLVIIHVAILVFPTSLLVAMVVDGEVNAFLMGKLVILGPLYLILGLVFYFSQSQRGGAGQVLQERFYGLIPYLGKALREKALARFTVSLQALLNAGVGVTSAWGSAAEASGSVRLFKAVQAIVPKIEAGATPGEAIQAVRAFPPMFVSLYNTGELSGDLDGTLNRLYQHYHLESARRLTAFTTWLPRFIVWIVMLYVAYSVLQFFLDYFSGLGDLLE